MRKPPSYDAVLYRKRRQDLKSRVAARGGVAQLLACYSERPKHTRLEYTMQLRDRVCEHEELNAMAVAAGSLKD
jgi:hypothetical protein